jgi:hypothetical protein
MTRLSAILVAPFLFACGDDPLSYSAPVSLNLKAKSSDTSNGTVTSDKSITTESGNPFGAFVSDARRTLGRDPSHVEVDRVELLLGGSSTGVSRLGEVFAGQVDVLFQMNDTNNSYPVASTTVAADRGPGPVQLGISFDGTAVPAIDQAKFLGGSFKVILRGSAAAGFETKGAEADLQVTLTFAAFE